MAGNSVKRGGAGRSPEADGAIIPTLEVVAPEVVLTINGATTGFPVSDLISADTPNTLVMGSDGLLLVQPQIVFDDQDITMVNTPSITGILTPSSPIGVDNQVNYTLQADVNISASILPYPNALVVNPDGLYVPTVPDVLTTYTDVVTNPHKIGEYTDEVAGVTDINETLTTLTDNGNRTFTYVSEDGTNTIISVPEFVTYSLSTDPFPTTPVAGDEHFYTTTGIAPIIESEIVKSFIFDGTQWTERPVFKQISIPTPRIWARNRVTTNVNQGTDINSISTITWNIPEIYAQNFSPNDALWRTLNPVYELIVHKRVKGYPSRIPKNTYKWVHPVNGQPGSTGKKYAAGSTRDHNNGTTWDDRFTEWTTDLASVPTFLKNLDPHDFMSFKAGNLTVNGLNPIIGAWSENSFREVFCFAPKRASKSGNIKMAFAVRIRVDNPEFIAGVAGQEPYLYGDASNVLVFKPSMFNLWDGATVDIDNNNVLEHYFFGWRATEENSTQY